MRLNRENDKRKEIMLMPVFDKFYNETIVKDNFTFERNYKTDLQIKGIDVIMCDYNNDEKFLVDEKCAVHFYKRDNQLKTYSFEIFSLNNRNYDGWFCNNDFYLTTHYSLFYPMANDSDLENIEKLDMILIEKEKIWDYIRSCGFNDKDDLLKYFEYNKEESFERDYCYINEYMKMVQSKTFKEKPINIIIKREKLESLAVKKYTHNFEEWN